MRRSTLRFQPPKITITKNIALPLEAQIFIVLADFVFPGEEKGEKEKKT